MHYLEGKVALITGSSRGIGRAIALSLAGAGADIVLNFRSRAAEAAAVEAQILRIGRRCIGIQADVSVAAEVTRLVAAGQDQLGPVDILVNNAGISRPQAIEEIS